MLEHKHALERKRAQNNSEHGKMSLLSTLQIFHFHRGNHRKSKPTNFHQKYELRKLRFLRENSKSFS